MRFLGSRTLEAPNVTLRRTREEDLKRLWEILLDEDVSKYYLFNKISHDWEKEKSFQLKKLKDVGNPDLFKWSIIKNDLDECIGQISLLEVPCEDVHIRELQMFLDPKFQHKSLMHEAAIKAFDYMFKVVGINEIRAEVAACNEDAWHLLEKLGFIRDDNTKFIKFALVTGKTECYLYSIKRNDWLKQEF